MLLLFVQTNILIGQYANITTHTVKYTYHVLHMMRNIGRLLLHYCVIHCLNIIIDFDYCVIDPWSS